MTTNQYGKIQPMDVIRLRTQFGEDITASKKTVFQVKPTWGVTEVRNITSTANTGDVSEVDGEIRLKTGTTTNSTAVLETRERGQYQPGSVMEPGVYIRIPTDPTGDQFAEWGYFDANNGFGFGIDSTGPYVFHKRAGTQTKIRQTDWNIDTLDGSEDKDNPSKATFDASDGNVYVIPFVWYGGGDVIFQILQITTDDDGRTKRDLINIHLESFQGQTSIIDPNQPIKVKVGNGTTSSNFETFVSGRQVSVISGDFDPQERPVTEVVSQHTLDGSDGTWEPIMTLRKKTNFNGRTNSTRVKFQSLDVQTDNPIETRVTFNDSGISGDSYSAPTGWDSSETAVETDNTPDGFTVSTPGLPILRQSIDSGKNKETAAEENARIVFGAETNITIWARKTSATDAEITAVAKWVEEW